MIWLADADNRCIYFNRAWLEFTGRPLAAELGEGWLEGVHPEDRERCREADARGFASRPDFRLEYRLRRHDGAYQWLGNEAAWLDLVHPDDRRRVREQAVHATAERRSVAIVYRVRHRTGHYLWLEDRACSTAQDPHVIGFVSDMTERRRNEELLRRNEELLRRSEERFRLATDVVNGIVEPERMVGCSLGITALKQAQQQILELNAELEKRVAERTAALRAANQEFEAFTYSVSHDPRAPLRHVAGFTELLRSRLGQLDPQAARYLETITDATTRMAEMIDKLLGVFQRLHAPGEFEGTGIGLASVRRIINRHGGRVWAQGTPGAGAEFHFTLPAREEQ